MNYKVPLSLAGLVFAAFPVCGNDVYIAQSGVGRSDGSSCANARGVTFFNSSSNWSKSGGIIGPGTTVHLCGVFNAPAGTDGMVSFQAGGQPGNPITLVAEPGTLFQAPYWGEHGAITASGVSNLVINGNNNGVIQATANGTVLANQGPANCGNRLVCSSGINLLACDNCVVQNWTVANLYVNVPPNDESAAGEGSWGIFFNGGNNITISGNTVHDAKWCMFYGYFPNATTQNAQISGNTGYNCDHGFALYSDNSGAILKNVTIAGNIFHDAANWDDNQNNNHHDGIHFSPTQTNTRIDNVSIYNNYIYGDWGSHCNAFIYIAGGTPDDNETITGVSVFNNLLVNVSAANVCANGLIQDYASQNTLIANNTLIGSTQSAGQALVIEERSPYRATVENNILSGFQYAFYIGQNNTFPVSDFNLLYRIASIANVWGSNCCDQLGFWRSQTGSPDVHSLSSNPNLSNSYAPQPGSPAIRGGANLTNLGIVALDTDKAGVARPIGNCAASGGSSCWDVGAYQGQIVKGSKPNPPTGLLVQVQ